MKPHEVFLQKAHSGVKLLGRVAHAYKREGFSSAARMLANSLREFVPGRRRQNQPSEFDREFGVDTSGIVRIASMEISSPNYLHARYYKATKIDFFLGMMEELGVDASEYTFIDYGSGKGLVLLLASHYPFKEIIGVEFGADLVRIAEENAASYQNPARKCSNIRSVCGDAAEFEPPAGPLLAYCYDPFGPPVLKGVLAKLAEAYKQSPRPIIFVFHGAAPGSSLYEEAAEREQMFNACAFMRQTRNEPTLSIYESPEVRTQVPG